MADPVAILGATAAASQLAEQGSKILICIFKVYSRIKDAPGAVQNGLIQVEQLIGLSRLVIQNPALQTDSVASILSTCLRLARKLQFILTQLIPVQGSGRASRLEKALTAVIKERDINELFEKLDREKTSLTVCIEEINSTLLRTVNIAVQGIQNIVGDILLVVSDNARNAQTIVNVLEGTASQVTTVYERMPEMSSQLTALHDDMIPTLLSLIQTNQTSMISTNKEKGRGYYNIPLRRVKKFYGRRDVLDRLQEGFSPTNLSEDAPLCIVLRGLGGQGKSQIALEYCQQTKATRYATIFWVDATSEGTARRSFKAFYDRTKQTTDILDHPDDIASFVRGTLAEISEPWLLVLDNYDDPTAFANVQDFLALGLYGSILITSRNAAVNALASYGWGIEIEGLDEKNAIELLFESSQLGPADHDISEAQAIIRRLACHPLAIVQAGAYIVSLRLPLQDFIHHYQRRRQRILEQTPQMAQYRRKLDDSGKETSLSVFTTWELSFHQLKLDKSQNYKKADLLTTFAFFNGDDISEEMFQVFTGNMKPWNNAPGVEPLPGAFLEASLQNWDHDVFSDMLAQYYELCLIQDFSLSEDGYYHLSVHPLVRDWIRLRTPTRTRQEYFMLAAEILLEVLNPSSLPERHELTTSGLKNILSHVVPLDDELDDQLCEQVAEDPNIAPCTLLTGLRGTQVSLASLLAGIGRYGEAAQLYRRVVAALERSQGQEDTGTLEAKVELSRMMSIVGRYNEAEKLQLAGLEVAMRYKGPNHNITNQYLSCLSASLEHLGKLKQARNTIERLLTNYVQTQGWGSQPAMCCASDRLLILARKGDFEEADELYTRIHPLASTLFGPKYIEAWMFVSRNIGLTLFYMSRFAEAKKLLWQVQKLEDQVYGKQDPRVVYTRIKLAASMVDDLLEAEDLIRKAVDDLESIWGPDHPETLEGHIYVGKVLCRQGNLDEAEQHLRHAVEGYLNRKGTRLPETSAAMTSLALVLREKGQFAAALEMAESAVAERENMYGPQNPYTQESLDTLQSIEERM